MKKHSERFKDLMKRDYKGIDSDDLTFTDEEIIFLCKEDLITFGNKYPGIAEYYMQTLSD
jgi:hypothetical protein